LKCKGIEHVCRCLAVLVEEIQAQTRIHD
jgi:hypothetical protein